MKLIFKPFFFVEIIKHNLRIFKKKIILLVDPIIRTAPNHKFIFIHINKTGGTSIGKAIGLRRKRHLTVSQIISKIGEQRFSNTFVFCVVRNPWDKVLSLYKYRVKTNQTNMRDNHISFNEWVKQTYGKEKNIFYYNKPLMFAPQSDWLKDKNGNLRVDKVLKFESLSDDFQDLTTFLGYNSKYLGKENSTEKVNYKNFYDESSRKIIEEWFSEDIKLFNYSFDD